MKRMDRAARAFELRKAGYDYTDIADIITEEWAEAGKGDELPDSWGRRYAHKDVVAMMADLRSAMSETLLEVAELEMARLDTLMAAVWDKAVGGKYEAIDRVLKIMDRRAKLLGLDKTRENSDWKMEIISLLEAGKITMAQVRKELGDDLATQLVEFINTKDASNGAIKGAIEIRPSF